MAPINWIIRRLHLERTASYLDRFGTALKRLPELDAAYLDHRRLALDNDWQNLVRSLPVSLRTIKRELADNRAVAGTRAEAESRAAALARELDLLRQRLDQTSGTTDYLVGRVEFVRRELMFELRYGASSPKPEPETVKAKTMIASPEKLAAAKAGRLRLNLGCGHIPLDSYLNVDRRPMPGVDIVAEVDDLPFEPEEVDEIFSAHLLEHFPQEELRRTLLPYWTNLLKKGGEFRAVVPDAESMIRGYADGSYPYDDLREVTFGAQDYDGDFHFNMFVPDQLRGLLAEAGLSDVELLEQGRRNGACFEMEIRGYLR